MKKIKKINIIFGGFVGVILVLILVLTTIAIIQGKPEPSDSGVTGSTQETQGIPETEEDYFDPNKVFIRSDPVIMYINNSGVKFSEFNYFYFEAVKDTIIGLEYPVTPTDEQLMDEHIKQTKEIVRNAMENGVGGKSFDQYNLDAAREKCILYIFERKECAALGYSVSEMSRLYYESNFKRAENMQELIEVNNNLLYEFGVVRNEFIDISLYLDITDKLPEEIIENISKKMAEETIEVNVEEDVYNKVTRPEFLEMYKN